MILAAAKKLPKKQKRVLKLKKANHSNNPTYLSGTYTEYRIKQSPTSLFYITKYRGGRVPREIQGTWTSHRQCEEALVKWLEKTDKRQQSRYPGCPDRRETNYTRTFLADL